jgi:hypothetical protein
MDFRRNAHRCLLGCPGTLLSALLLACAAPDTREEVPSEAGSISSEGTSELPAEIHGLALTEMQSGADAADAVGSLHGRSVAPLETRIGIYGPPEMRVAVYRSRFGSSDEAYGQLEAMATRIGSGSSGYGHHVEADVAGTPVHQVFGHGQVHYFFAQAAYVTWLSAPPSIARPALAELLGLGLDSLPEIRAPMEGAEDGSPLRTG